MSEEERLNPFNIEQMTILACGSAVLSVIFIVIKDYTFALSLGLSSLFLFLFAQFRQRLNAELPRSFIWFGFILIVVLSVMVGSKTGSYINKSAPQQSVCGQVENVYMPQRRGIETFDLAAQDQRVNKLPYFMYKQKIEEANHHICVQYSFAEHWSNHPHIHSLVEWKKSR